MEITQEELSKMSPEEIKELQEKNCIFCHIVKGKVQSKKVYEDDICMAVLDINPANPGHILLMPKKHYSIMPQVSKPDIGHMFMVVKSLSNSLLKALKVTGTTIFVANGVAAGQKAPHFMIHIIPRKEGDNVSAFHLHLKDVSRHEMSKSFNLIQTRIDDIFGITREKPVDLDKTDVEPEKVTPPSAESIPEQEDKTPEKKEEPEEPMEKKKESKEEQDDKKGLDLDSIASLFTGK